MSVVIGKRPRRRIMALADLYRRQMELEFANETTAMDDINAEFRDKGRTFTYDGKNFFPNKREMEAAYREAEEYADVLKQMEVDRRNKCVTCGLRVPATRNILIHTDSQIPMDLLMFLVRTHPPPHPCSVPLPSSSCFFLTLVFLFINDLFISCQGGEGGGGAPAERLAAKKSRRSKGQQGDGKSCPRRASWRRPGSASRNSASTAAWT